MFIVAVKLSENIVSRELYTLGISRFVIEYFFRIHVFSYNKIVKEEENWDYIVVFLLLAVLTIFGYFYSNLSATT